MGLHNKNTNDLRDYIDGTTLDVANVFEIGEWVHITIVWDATAKKRKIYVNGIYKNGDASAITTGTGRDEPLAFGGFNNRGSVTAQFNGSIDDVRIYNRVLTIEEISALASGN